MNSRGRDMVEELLSTVEHLRIAVGAEGRDREWLRCSDLMADPSLLLSTVRSTASGWGAADGMVAMSLFVQGYAYRIASVAIGSFVLSGDVLPVRPESTAIALDRHLLNAVRLDDAEPVATGGDPVALRRVLIDGHLAPFVDAVHRSMLIGEALLWGNVGSSCAAGFGALVGPLADRAGRIRRLAEGFFAGARPELARAGRVVLIGEGLRWAWERNACCLFYQAGISEGVRCVDCSLWTPAERSARYAGMIEET